MELYNEILMNVIYNENVQVSFPDLEIDFNEIIKNKCYDAIVSITEIIKNDKLNDKECFEKIEEIICVLEQTGISCGNRHD